MALAPFADAVRRRARRRPSSTRRRRERGTRSASPHRAVPVAVGSRGLEAVLVTFPGFAQNANGAIHPRGAHNQMTYVVDGLPISDQLTGAFANALDVGVVQTVELITGNIPAEFGSKVSGVAVVTSRSGLGTGRPLAGSRRRCRPAGSTRRRARCRPAGERGRVGYFGSVTAMRTDRFLDQVSLDNLHNARRLRARVRAPRRRRRPRGDTLRVHVDGRPLGASNWPTCARSKRRAGPAPGARRRVGLGLVPAHARCGLHARSHRRLPHARRPSCTPSAGDTPVTAARHATLSHAHARRSRSRARSGRTCCAPASTCSGSPSREWFTMAITALVQRAGCAGLQRRAPAARPDARRHAVRLRRRAAGTRSAPSCSPPCASGPATLNVGLRHDVYRFLVNGRQLQPRVGVA